MINDVKKRKKVEIPELRGQMTTKEKLVLYANILYYLVLVGCVTYIALFCKKLYDAYTYMPPEELSVYQGEVKNDKNTECIGEIEKLFCKKYEHNEEYNYKWDVKKMIKIARCESNLNPEAYYVNVGGTVDMGVFQINSIHGQKPSDMFNAEKNVHYGYTLWEQQGEAPWVFSEHCWGANEHI